MHATHALVKGTPESCSPLPPCKDTAIESVVYNLEDSFPQKLAMLTPAFGLPACRPWRNKLQLLIPICGILL